jgi:hypothetical protein
MWFSFPGGWGDYELNGPAEKELAATFAHGYATQKLADAHPNAAPNVAQQALLQLFKDQSVSPAGAGVVGVLQTPNSTGGVSGAASNVASSVLGLPKLSNTRDLVIRTVKVVVGIALIVVGISSLMRSEGVSAPVPPVVPV